MTVLAVIGSTALWLTYVWLASAILASYLSNLKGYGERPGLASGLLLSAGGVLLWLVWPPRAAAAERGELALKWSPWRVLAFNLMSGGLYGFYWFFLTREMLNRELRKETNTALETAGLIVPVLNVFILYRLYGDVNELRRQKELSTFGTVPYAILGAIPGLHAIIDALVTRDLDEYWDETGRGAVRLGVTLRETLLAAAGFVAVALVLIFVL